MVEVRYADISESAESTRGPKGGTSGMQTQHSDPQYCVRGGTRLSGAAAISIVASREGDDAEDHPR